MRFSLKDVFKKKDRSKKASPEAVASLQTEAVKEGGPDYTSTKHPTLRSRSVGDRSSPTPRKSIDGAHSSGDIFDRSPHGSVSTQGTSTSMHDPDFPTFPHKSMSADGSISTFRKLPLEVLLKVVEKLDCHSVRSLVLAVPWLKRHTIVISNLEHQKLFFKIKGVRSVKFEQFKITRSWNTLQDKTIKLFDFEEKVNSIWGCYNTLLLSGLLDELSFVHYTGLLVNKKDFSLVPSKVMYQDFGAFGSKVFLSGSAQHAQKLVFLTNKRNLSNRNQQAQGDNSSTPDPIALFGKAISLDDFNGQHTIDTTIKPSLELNSSIKIHTLDITGTKTGVISGLNSDTVRLLRIHAFRQPGGKPVVIKDINCPELFELKISYAGPMPVMHKIKVCTPADTLRLFELTETTSFTDPHKYAHDTETRMEMYKEQDLSFISMFSDIKLVGVPPFVVKYVLLLEKILQLQVFQTMTFEDPDVNIPPKEKTVNHTIRNFFLFVTVPHAQLPRINFSILKTLNIIVTAPHVKLNSIMQHTGTRMDQVSIVCHLPESEIGGDGHLKITGQDLKSLAEHKLLCSVRFSGCLFGDYNEDIEKVSLPTDSMPALKKVRLDLVRRTDQEKMDNSQTITVALLKGVSAPSLKKLRITQRGAEGRRWQYLRYWIHSDVAGKGVLSVPAGQFDWISCLF